MNKESKVNALLKALKASNLKRKIRLRTKKLKTGAYSIYLDHYDKGDRSFEFPNLYITGDAIRDDETFRKAILIRDKREKEIDSNEYGLIDNWKAKSDFIAYYKHLADKKTYTYWNACYKNLHEFHPQPLPFTHLNANFFERLKEYLLAKISPNTASLYLNTIKAALNQAIRERIITVNPARDTNIKKRQTDRNYITKEQASILEATPCRIPDVKKAFLFACYSGLRYSDIEKLSWKNIEAESIIIRMKKTDTILRVPIMQPARALIGQSGEGKVFNLPSHPTVNKVIQEWLAEAKIDKEITFHCARHSFAIFGLEAGIPINIIQKLLGHQTLATTLIYAKVKDKLIDQAAQQLNNFFSQGE